MSPARPAKKRLHPLLEAIGQRVRSRRQELKLTLKGVAAQSGLSERFLADLEAGRANISVVNLAELASSLQLSLAALVDLEGTTAEPKGVVALLGLRGAGKSTVGRSLADKLGCGFFELDRLVEAEAGMGLAEIFAIHGEDYFRQVELLALRKFLAAHPRAVLATGGGLVTSAEAYRLLVDRAHTVWLRATPEEHWERVVGQGDLRPMQNRPHAMSELKRRLKERQPLYSKARRQVVTSSRTVNAVVQELADALWG